MARPLPPIWDILDVQPNAETLHLLSLVDFTDLLNGCAPDALVRNAFVILRMVATARYLHLKSQELHEALMEACDTAVRTQYVLPVTSPVSLLTQTSFHHTFCTVHTVHTVCSPSLL